MCLLSRNRSLVRRPLRVAAILLLLLPCIALAQTRDDDLPVDPAVRSGRLDNGLTWIVRENGRPEARAELRLVVDAGSVDEDDDQKGFAHFVEHMLFNGTERYAGNDLIDYFESIGARFGADLNAYTSFDETVYMLTIPTDGDGLLREGVRILEQFAHAATMDGEEIERERGVVLDEWRRTPGCRQPDPRPAAAGPAEGIALRGAPAHRRSGDPALRRGRRDPSLLPGLVPPGADGGDRGR